MIHFGFRFTTLLAVLFISYGASALSNFCGGARSIHCGKTPSAVFDNGGRLLAVFKQDKHVYFTVSRDAGKTYSEPRAVNSVPETIYANGENRPKIALGKDEEILVSWTQKTAERFSGNIRFSRSIDGGNSFSVPITVNDDGLMTSHRFDQLHVTPSGRVYIAWLDKRDKVAAMAEGGKYKGAALYYAVSDDAGLSFSNNIKVADGSCECCRIASANHGSDNMAVFWRHIYGLNTRDHGLAVLTPKGPAKVDRATQDEWKIDACPHHGPHMASATEPGRYHLVWFSQGDVRKGIHYGMYNAETAVMSNVIPVDHGAGASHPLVAAVGNTVYVLWKFYDGEITRLQLNRSIDGGANWQSTETLLTSSEDSDHPQLIAAQGRVFIGWSAKKEGYRVIEIH